jgi:hypothetical protein
LYLDQCECPAVPQQHTRVIDWRYLDDKRSQVPRKKFQEGYVAFFEDYKYPGVFREVTSTLYFESHTFYDKERADHDIHSLCDRRELQNPKKKSQEKSIVKNNPLK